MKKPTKPAGNKKASSSKTKVMERFDALIPKEQKDLFIKAAALGGYRTLTEFVISSVKEKAELVLKKHEIILASEKDKEIFFNALTNPPKPNAKLISASKRYKKMVSAKEPIKSE